VLPSLPHSIYQTVSEMQSVWDWIAAPLRGSQGQIGDPLIAHQHRDPARREGVQGRGLRQALDRRGSVISTMPGDVRLAWAIQGP